MRLLYTFLLILPSLTFASSKPLYEFGVAGFIADLPDYPASDQKHTRYLMVPTFLYRGFVLRSDKKGARARFFKLDKLDIDLSLGGSLPASSKDNKAREDMDDLDTLLELGPRINYDFIDTEDELFSFQIPLRSVISTDIQHTEERGFRLAPQVSYEKRINEKYKYTLSYRLNYASEKLQDYFYEVQEKDATNRRNQFNAQAGYLGSDLAANLIYKKNTLAMIVGIRHSSYEDATNIKSPLYRVKEDTSIFFGFNWFYFQSKEKGSN